MWRDTLEEKAKGLNIHTEIIKNINRGKNIDLN